MEDFSALIEKATYSFGSQARPDVPSSHFPRLELPKKYLAATFHKQCKNASGVKIFLFLLDFCSRIHGFQNCICLQEWDKRASKLGFGEWIPRTKELFMKFIQEMQMCIVQVIDRISENQLRSSRREAAEYESYIPPLKGEIKFPKANNPYPDFAGKSWMTKLKTGEIGNDEQQEVTTLQTIQLPKKKKNKGKTKASGVIPKKSGVTKHDNCMVPSVARAPQRTEVEEDEEDVVFVARPKKSVSPKESGAKKDGSPKVTFIGGTGKRINYSKDVDMMEKNCDVINKVTMKNKKNAIFPLVARARRAEDCEEVIMTSKIHSSVNRRALPKRAPPLCLLSQDRVSVLHPYL